MKKKAIIKKCTALACVIGSTLLAIGSMCCAALGAANSTKTLREFQNSDEYKTAVVQKLTEAQEIYNNSAPSLEAEKAFFDAQKEAYSLDFAEDLLKNSKSEYGKEYDTSKAMKVVGLSAGLVGFVAASGSAAALGSCIGKELAHSELGKKVKEELDK